jgi:hypothetical protein
MAVEFALGVIRTKTTQFLDVRFFLCDLIGKLGQLLEVRWIIFTKIGSQ